MSNLLTFAFLALFVCGVQAQTVSLAPKDLRHLDAAKWTGTLTYVDYGSGKRTSIKSNLTVTKRADNTWIFAYEYPDEPKANSASDVILRDDGKVFDDKTIESRTKHRNGVIEIVASKRGTDNGKPATFRFTYRISKREFSIRKDVLIDGSDSYFERNTYSWRR